MNPKDQKHQMTLVWLHGMKDGAQDFREIFLDPNLVKLPEGCKIVLPTAPSRRITVNGGQESNSWFDVRQCGIPDKEELLPEFIELAYNQEQIRESINFIKNLLVEEAKELNGDYSKIFLGGFAEGCSIALATFINFQHKLGGVIVFSGIHCAEIDWTDVNLDQKRQTPLYIYGDASQKPIADFSKTTIDVGLKANGLTHFSYRLERGLDPKFSALLLTNVFKEIQDRKKDIKVEDSTHQVKKIKKSYKREGDQYKITLSDGLTIELVNSTITNEKVDAIVNCTNSVLKHQFAGSQPKAILQVGGPQLQKESDDFISKNGSLAAGKLLETSAGNLSAKKVIHVACPSWERKLTKFQNLEKLQIAIQNVFQYALEEQKYESIAIGAIGSGVFGFDIQFVAECMLKLCVTCRFKGHVRIVLDEDTALQAFEQHFNKQFLVQKDAVILQDNQPEIPMEDIVKTEQALASYPVVEVKQEFQDDEQRDLQSLKTVINIGNIEKPPGNKYYMRLYGNGMCPFTARDRYYMAAKRLKFQQVMMDVDDLPDWHKEFNEGMLPMLETPSGDLIGEPSFFWKKFKSELGVDLFLKPKSENKKMIELLMSLQQQICIIERLKVYRFQENRLFQGFKEHDLPVIEHLTRHVWDEKWIMGTEDLKLVDVYFAPFLETIYLLRSGPLNHRFEALELETLAPSLIPYVERFRKHKLIAPVKMDQQVSSNYWSRALKEKQPYEKLCKYSTADYENLPDKNFTRVGRRAAKIVKQEPKLLPVHAWKKQTHEDEDMEFCKYL